MRKAIILLIAILVVALALYFYHSAPKPIPALTLLAEPIDTLGVDDPLVLTFSRPVQSFEQNIALTPTADVEIEWSKDFREVRLEPKMRWEYAQDYIIDIGGVTTAFSTKPIPVFSLLAGGDVLLDESPGENIARYGPEYVFADGVKELLRKADIAFVNLESPASARGTKITPKTYNFRSTPQALDALVDASIDVVSFANNHCLDYGMEAFLDTLNHLQERGIAYVGAGVNRAEVLSPHIVEIKGVRAAFLAFTDNDFLPTRHYSLWEAKEDKPGTVFIAGDKGRADVLEAVKNARLQADIVIVSLHWGTEGTTAPHNWQREFGRKIIDAGATVIVGHHPHVPFGVEIYQDRPIIYSLGNFLFQPYAWQPKECFVAHMEISLLGEVQIRLHPILLNDGTVTLLTGEQANRMSQTLINRSRALGTELVREGDYLVVASSREL